MQSFGSIRKSHGLGSGLATTQIGSGGSSTKLKMSPPMSFPNLMRSAHLTRNMFIRFTKKSFISLI